MKHKIGTRRLWVLFFITSIALGVLSWRIIDIAWQRHDSYRQAASAQAGGVTNILLRGNVYLQSIGGQTHLAATNRKFPFLEVVPSRIELSRIPEIAGALQSAAGISPETVEKVIRAGGSGGRTLARHLTDAQASVIADLDLPGIAIGYETDRSYPLGPVAADVIGFYGHTSTGQRAGQYGIEAAFDRSLSGISDAASRQFDLIAQLKRLVRGEDALSSTQARPHDIELTIDRNVQSYAQKLLGEVVQRYGASSGVLLVQEPATGRLLAMADSPSFDPNFYGTFPLRSFANGAIEPFEPGSSFKPFTMAIGLDANKITPTTVYNDDHDIVVDGYTIKNFNESHFGRVTMTEVLEKSVNAGTMYVQSLLSNDQFLQGLVNLGFGQKTGIELLGESAGTIENLYTGRRINFMTASFGQGITTTPLQLVGAYSAIANGGKLMRPSLVHAVIDNDGTRHETIPEVLGTPFLDKTAAKLRAMLVSVVDKGFDKARIPRYDVAGKTGTAQIASPDGGYLEGQYNHSFVGFAPASDPRFTVFIRIERPQGITFAADSLSPVFKDMMAYLLNYYSVPPTR